ncbi:hypothetical protein ACTNE3_03145 [Bacillota bacterium HCP3S3_F1_1]
MPADTVANLSEMWIFSSSSPLSFTGSLVSFRPSESIMLLSSFPVRRLPVLDKFDYMDGIRHKKSKKHPSLSHSLKMKAKMDAKNVLQ